MSSNVPLLEIDISKLKIVTNLLFDHLEEVIGDKVSFPLEDYWHIRNPDIYDIYNTPKELTLGKLSWDWEWLNNILEEDDPYPILYEFKYISVIFRAISDMIMDTGDINDDILPLLND